MIDLPLTSTDRPGRRPLFLHENGFQMEVVIERDSQHDRLLLGRVERRWPHGTSASGRAIRVVLGHRLQMMSAGLFYFRPPGA